MKFDFIVKGGTVVEPHQATISDIAVRGGKIVKIAPFLDAEGNNHFFNSVTMLSLRKNET